MCPPAASQLADIGFDCSDEEIFKSLDKMTHGVYWPGNVITGVNPYNQHPSNLPEDIWFLIHSKENVDTGLGFGFWKFKVEDMLFSNSIFIGWRTTHEFFEIQVPNVLKTDWLMHEYWITRRGLVEDGQIKETGSLCRVFLGGEQLGHEEWQKVDSSHGPSGASNHSKQSVGLQAHNESKPEVHKNNETGVCDVDGRPLNHPIEDLAEIDYVHRGDYLELLDLDIPASPSSSSDNSSCLTMSSDDYFDSVALMRELESEKSKDQLEKCGNCKFSVSASVKPDKVVVLPASPEGSFVDAEGRKPHSQGIIETDSVIPGLINCVNKDLVDKATDQSSVRKENVYCRDEGPSSNPHDAGQSSGSPNGGRKDGKGRMKRRKRKYLCFMPFHFLF